MNSAKVSLFLLVFVTTGWNSIAGPPREWKNDLEGGYIYSPGFSLFRTYSDNLRYRYTVNGPEGYIVILTFEHFKVQGLKAGRKTDYLTVYDGRKTDDRVGKTYYGFKEVPFRFVSSTRRVRMLFVTDYYTSYTGFKIRYDFINPTTHCEIRKLQTRNRTATDCRNEISGFATQCTISCHDGYQLQGSNASRCTNTEFSQVTCEPLPSPCNISTLATTRSRVVNCEYTGSGYVQSCRVACLENYELKEGSSVNCMNGQFSPPCKLISGLVSKCEESNMVDCPYLFDEIIKFYDVDQLDVDPNITEENKLDEEDILDGLPDPIVSVGRGIARRTKCWPHYCRQIRNGEGVLYYPFKCGRARGPYLRKACLHCRYKTKCERPPPLYL